MATSANGWPVIASADSADLHDWIIPAGNGRATLKMRAGRPGFVLAWVALREAETIVALKGKIPDDWGYAYRPIRGESTGFSNHASGTAMDLNASAHPLSKVGTWTTKQAAAIRRLLALNILHGTVDWGGNYHGRKDEMHFELAHGPGSVQHVAKELAATPRGKRLLAVNPGQAKLI